MIRPTKGTRPSLVARMATLGAAGLVALAASGCAQLPDQRYGGGYPGPDLSALPPLNIGVGYNARSDNVGFGIGTGFYAGPVYLDVGAWY